MIVAKTPKFTISGTLNLTDYGDGIFSTDTQCVGRGGYGDLSAGMPITIRDGSGNILASTQLNTGTFEGDSEFVFSCDFNFSAEVPKADFYSLEFGRRGEFTYSFDEMKEVSWKIYFSL